MNVQRSVSQTDSSDFGGDITSERRHASRMLRRCALIVLSPTLCLGSYGESDEHRDSNCDFLRGAKRKGPRFHFSLSLRKHLCIHYGATTSVAACVGRVESKIWYRPGTRMSLLLARHLPC